MELITAIFLFLVGRLGTACSRLLADECHAWIPWIIQRVIRRAIMRLPSTQRERFQEEWQSHVNEVPGEIGKLAVSLGFLTAARKMTLAAKRHPPIASLLESAFPPVGNAKNLREQMTFIAAKLLDYGYLFPPLGPIESSEKDEILKYYSDSIRPELECLLSKFAQQERHLLEQSAWVHCEYHKFRKYVEVTHLPELQHLFGRHDIEEMAKQLALLALRVKPVSNS
jgi:hypothetical protein